MALISIQTLTLSFGGPPLLDGVDLHIEAGERLCLLGRNGAGKSTLLKVMAGLLQPDAGDVTRTAGVRTAYLGQEIPEGMSGTALETASDGEDDRRLDAERLLTLFGIDPERELSSMSGGEKRRVLLAGALASHADVLLLDEPTNHLDIDTVLRLEEYLLRKVKTCVFVTHDRAFAKRLSNRVAEIDRGTIYAFRATYEQFLERREELLEAEARKRAGFDKRLAEEEAWLRRGVKARRTRNEGRVKALEAMREQYRQRRDRTGTVAMEIHDAGRSGDLVAETVGLTFGYGEEPLIRGFTTMVMRGDRVGIVGPNGSGKTTLLRLLLGELEPDAGRVRLGTNLRPVYFDQMRSELDPSKSVIENLGDGYDTIELNGRKRHIIGYLEDFLFTADRAKSPVAHLSGGERNRLLLAKFFARPSNLLVLDEPTNDLDLETLELLEEILQEYRGTLLLVSHDRAFLDNVVTDCFVFAGDGRVIEYVGGYGDWRLEEERRRVSQAQASPKPAAGSGNGRPRPEKPRKLSFREKQELEALPGRIARLEGEIESLHAELADPALYRSGSGDPAALAARLRDLEAETASAYERWEFLDSL